MHMGSYYRVVSAPCICILYFGSFNGCWICNASNYTRECLDSLGSKMRIPLHRSLVVGSVA